ncbi:MAG: Hsp20/alpha crystallin family protein [Armatimonadetes bacterium]|nr:Hsp20/alpha crystallin family protein [Armatimonadota bacterium]MDW8122582.1 Hsp20/alpha crystallin family protein [Armatimonadota bacterium]
MAQIRRWSPFSELEAFRREMDRFWREFFGEEPRAVTRAWLPAIDLSETPTHLTIQAELPGVSKDNLNIDVSEDRVVIRGKKEPEPREDRTYHLLERIYGEFERSITLPSPVDADAAHATYKEGVLTIHLPKKEAKKTRRISIQVQE